MFRNLFVAIAGICFALGTPSFGVAEEKMGEIASQVSTGTSGADGSRVSADSDWTRFTVPDNFAINTMKTVVHVLNEQGSEHEYTLEYDDYVEITIGGFTIKQPRTVRVKTHARSSKGSFGGKGAMAVKVDFYYANFR